MVAWYIIVDERNENIPNALQFMSRCRRLFQEGVFKTVSTGTDRLTA